MSLKHKKRDGQKRTKLGNLIPDQVPDMDEAHDRKLPPPVTWKESLVESGPLSLETNPLSEFGNKDGHSTQEKNDYVNSLLDA